MNSKKYKDAFDFIEPLYLEYSHPYLTYDYALLLIQFSPKKAANLLKSLLKYDIENAEFYFAYHMVLRVCSKFKEARNMLRKALHIGNKCMLEDFNLMNAYDELIRLNLFMNDIHGYEEAVDMLIDYLKTCTSDEELQKQVVLCFVEISKHLENRLIRHHFKKLIDYLNNRQFFKNTNWVGSFKSAYVSLESYLLNENREIPHFINDFCVFVKNENCNLEQSIYAKAYRIIACNKSEVLKKYSITMEEVYPHFYSNMHDEINSVINETEALKNRMLDELKNELKKIGLTISQFELLNRLELIFDNKYDSNGIMKPRKGKNKNDDLIDSLLNRK